MDDGPALRLVQPASGEAARGHGALSVAVALQEMAQYLRLDHPADAASDSPLPRALSGLVARAP